MSSGNKQTVSTNTGGQENDGSTTAEQRNDNTNNNQSNNHQKNKNKKHSSNNQSNNSKFVGTESGLAVLSVKNDTTKTDIFLIFQRYIENHVLSKFDQSGDIAYLVQELKDPIPNS